MACGDRPHRTCPARSRPWATAPSTASYAANDGLAGGSISALKANKVDPLPPVTGQDAELAALRRIVDGEQYMTVFKPFGPEAAAGGAMAVAAAHGDSLGPVATGKVPTRGGEAVASVLLPRCP